MSTSKDNVSFDSTSKRLSVSSGHEESSSLATTTAVDDSMKLLRCGVSSLLAFHRGTFSCGSQGTPGNTPQSSLNSKNEDPVETDYFFFIHATRSKDKKGLFTDVTSFDSNDGIIVSQSSLQLQRGMVDFFTDEIQTYLVGNNEAIACTTTHYLLGTKIKERMDLFKKLKNAVEELAIEIPNHLEMFEFVLLKKEISGFEKSLTDKHAILKSLDEAFINLRSNDNVNQCKHFLRTAATDAAIVLENVNLPDNWSRSQFFQLLCEEVMSRAMKMIDVDKIFLSKSNEGAVHVFNALKLCMCWKTINEYVMDIHRRLFGIQLYEGNIFGSIMAFIRRCKDLYEICQANGQLFSAFSGQEETSSKLDKERQISRIYLEYSKLLSNISQVRHKCLDIKDDELGAYFVAFRKEMHTIDSMILDALKASFEGVSNIKEQCEILDTFHSMSDRARVKDTYFLRADSVGKQLYSELSRLIHEAKLRLNYTKLSYPSLIVNFIRAHGLIQRGNAVIDDVTSSNVFLGDIQKLKSINRIRSPLKKSLENMLVDYRKNTHFLDGMECDFKHFLITRSAGFEGTLDINISREFPVVPFITRMLECLGLSIIGSRTSQFHRQHLHQINISLVARLVTEYNAFFACRLSMQEKGVFRGKVLSLERKIWNGIYKLTWSEQAQVVGWCKKCEETIWTLTREIIEYKKMNGVIQGHLNDVKDLVFVKIDELSGEQDPDKFCKAQFFQINTQSILVQNRCNAILAQVKKIKTLVDIQELIDDNLQWTNYKMALATKLADAVVNGLAKSLKTLTVLLHRPQNKPILRINVTLQNKVLTLDNLGKDVCLFLDCFKETAANSVIRVISDQTWATSVRNRIDNEPELIVLEKILQNDVESSYVNIQKYLHTLNPLKDFWTLQPDNVLDYYKEECTDVDSFLKDLTKLKNISEVAAGISKKKWVSFCMIDATSFLKEVLSYCKTWEKEFIGILCALVEVNTDESQALLSDLSDLIATGEIQGKEDYMDEVLNKIESNIKDTNKVLNLLSKNGINTNLAMQTTAEIEKEYLTIKKDKNQILLQQRDASIKSMEQMKQLKIINKALEDLILSYKVQAPYTSSWKSEEALTEIASFQSKLEHIKAGVESYDIKDNIDNYTEKVDELEINLSNLRDIWCIVTDWEAFEKQTNVNMIENLMVSEVIREMTSFKEEVHKFSKRDYDSRIEIHLTLHNKLAIFEGNFSLIEDFRSKAIKMRHWEIISKACGFDAIKDDELIINKLTLEEFINLGLERQSAEIKIIIEKAKKEYTVEEHLANTMKSLHELSFKYKVSNAGIRVITNDETLQELIQSIIKSILKFKESEASEPFRGEIDSLEVKLMETKKKIDVIKKVENIFGIVSEVSTSYSLDLQLGKFQQKLSILTEIWKNIHQDISEHSDLVEAMNDESLEGNLWSFELEMTALEEKLMTFLSTRKFTFPKFSLCSSQKIMAIFCYREIDNFNKWVSLLFPHVQKLIVKQDANLITGYVTKTGFSRSFPIPINFEWTTDNIACRLQEGLRITFREEIAQNMVSISAKKTVQASKQETKTVALPMLTTFVVRQLGFCAELQRSFSDAAQQQKQHALDMLNMQNNRIANLTTLMLDAKNEDTSCKYNDAISVEVAVKQVMEQFVELVFSKELEEEVKQQLIKSKWTSMLKYSVVSKEPLDIQVSIHEKTLMFGFDEAANCAGTLMLAFRDSSLGYMGKLLVHSFGAALDGNAFSGRFSTMQAFSQILGRHLVPIAHFDYSLIDNLEDLLFSLEGTQDFICFHNIKSETVYNNLFTIILAYHVKVKEFKSMILNKVSLTGAQPEKFTARIFYHTNFPPNELLYVGKEYRVVAINKLHLIQIAQFALLAENFNSTMKLVQLVVISLTVISHQTRHHCYYHLKDIRHMLKRARQKMNTQNASADEAVIGAIIEAFPADKKVIISLFKSSVNMTGLERLVETQILDGQIKYCKDKNIILTPNFKLMLHNVTYSLQQGNHLLLYGGLVSQKTTMWKVATAPFNYETIVVSNLALEPDSDGICEMKHIPLLEQKPSESSNHRDLLLVLEGTVSPLLESTILALLQYNTFLLKDNGQLAIKERKVRVILETGENMMALSPALVSFFHLHKCENTDVSWEMSLTSKVYDLTRQNDFLKSKYKIINAATLKYVAYFLSIREKLDLPGDKVTKDTQMNSLMRFFSSTVCQYGSTLDLDDLQQLMIYACIFSFSQDVQAESKGHMGIKIRELYECRTVPTEQSIFDYFYDPSSKTWKPLRNHPLCSKTPSKGPILLRNHLKQEVIARIMIRNLVSVDIQGAGGVGKTTMLKNLMATFNTADFLGVAVPSCKGTSLSKITNSMLNCIRQQQNEDKSPDDKEDQGNKQLGGARRSVLFCIDDVDASDKRLSQFIKFFTEHSSWLTKTGIRTYSNQVLATTRQMSKQERTPFRSVQIAIDPIDSQELTNIFKTSLKEKFLEFELDIQFLITKVILASVDINKIFVGANINRHYFHLQDNMKIITGLKMAHKDCHDTKFELLELWVNEVYRAYFEKIPSDERPDMYDKVAKVMLHYFGDEAKEILEGCHETMIGDFLDPYNFYTTIELDELKEFVMEKVNAANLKLDRKLVVIANKTSLMMVCQMLRALALDNGHVLIYGSSLVCPQSLVELVCRIRNIRMFKLLDTDITGDKWKKKFRSITKICGLDKVKACLYVPLDLFDRIVEVRACLESFIDIGYDLSLFNPEELEIMTQKQGYFQELANHTKKNFHCVVVGKTFEQVECHFVNENFYVCNTGEYEDYLLEYAEEFVQNDHGVPVQVFQKINEQSHEFFRNFNVPAGMKPSLASYVSFMNIFNKFIEATIKDYQEIVEKIETIVGYINKHFDFSSEQMLILEKNRDKSKTIVGEHQAMTMKHIQTKKELKEIEGHLADGMNEYGDEQAAMLRLNMAIVEERTCQWSLFQRALRDFDDAVLDESNMNDFNWAQDNFTDVSDYMACWRDTFNLGEDDFCVKFKFFLSSILAGYDVKSLWQVGENEKLHLLKEKIYHEVSEGSIILHAIMRIHTRMETMSKSTKNIQTKEQKLQTLQKKCKSIEDKLKDLRQQNKNLEKRLMDEQTQIEELQASIASQNEIINSLEHSTTEHKNLKQPLQAFLDYLGKMKVKMIDEKDRLPGSIVLAAAACGYCGAIPTAERIGMINGWKEILTDAGVLFQDNFLPYTMSNLLRSDVAVAEATMTKQNLGMLSALDDPILIIDPLQIALEYLELLHQDDKITMLHIGDPTFKSQFIHEIIESNVIIINHSTLDLNSFASQVDLQKIKLANPKIVVYHVTPAIKESELIYINPSHIISFDLSKDDIAKYIHNRLQLLVQDKARLAEGDGNTIATDKDILDVELEPYITTQEQILDFNTVTHSVEHIKKIHDRSEQAQMSQKVNTAASAWAMKATGPLDLLRTYADVLTNAFVALKLCPFQNTVPISLQTCLTMSQKNLETLEGTDKKEINFEKIAQTIADSIMRIYDTNLSKFDCLALKTCLIFYLFANTEQDHAKVVCLMLEQLLSNMPNVTLFASQMKSIRRSASSAIATGALNLLAILASDLDHFEANAEKILKEVLPQKINNDRDLYRVYAKSSKDIPTVINVDIDITFLEALSKFRVNFQLDDFMVLNVAKPNFSPFRLLEEAIEKASWLICTGIENRSKCENLLDFMIRRLKTSKNVNDNFRFWIICQDMRALTLPTAQKCCSHFLGYEAPPDTSSKNRQNSIHYGEPPPVPITAFEEAKKRLTNLAALTNHGQENVKMYRSELRIALLNSLKRITCST